MVYFAKGATTEATALNGVVNHWLEQKVNFNFMINDRIKRGEPDLYGITVDTPCVLDCDG
jgi:hypothetical protein